jgi:hypothetical protein
VRVNVKGSSAYVQVLADECDSSVMALVLRGEAKSIGERIHQHFTKATITRG